jgi:CHAD domain-containing protein
LHQRLTEVTEDIEQAESELSHGYHAEQLYELRVGMRRVRSMLKSSDSPRDRRFRKSWGGFATVTNQARDWDVFLTSAAALLPLKAFQRFEKQHREAVQASHEAVIDLLQSPHWRRHLDEWRHHVRQIADESPNKSEQQAALSRALDRARAALTTAQQEDTDRAWHKLRIAVKEVRYQAESIAGDAPGDQVAVQELTEHCKNLQSLLGRWHDCVVQLQMLEEMEPAPEQDALRTATDARRVECLAEIRQALIDHPLFEPSGNSATSARSDASSGS